MRQNVYYRNLKWTFEDLLPCCCYAIKTNVEHFASKIRNLSLQAKDRTWANCAIALSVSGTLGHDFVLMDLAFIYPALPTCLVVYVQKSNFHLINMFCIMIVKNVLCLAQIVFSYFVLHSSKLTLVLTTEVANLRSLPDSLVRRVYLANL